MTLRIRLITRDQVKDLNDSGLHDVLVGRCRGELEEALRVVEPFVANPDGVAFLDEAANALADRLRRIDRLRDEVNEAIQVGGMLIDDTDEMFRVLATWAIEQQLNGQLLWSSEASVRPKRRGLLTRLLGRT